MAGSSCTLPRYLKAVDAAPGQDARRPRCVTLQRLAELRPLEQRWLRVPGGTQGPAPTRGWTEYRWLLEELRVSLFAQELRTPQPVSAKRLKRAWSQLSS